MDEKSFTATRVTTVNAIAKTEGVSKYIGDICKLQSLWTIFGYQALKTDVKLIYATHRDDPMKGMGLISPTTTTLFYQ